jgi:hypothetical protein
MIACFELLRSQKAMRFLFCDGGTSIFRVLWTNFKNLNLITQMVASYLLIEENCCSLAEEGLVSLGALKHKVI